MTAPVFDDPRWVIHDEHEDSDGTWTQVWELIDDDGERWVVGESGIHRRARTTHPPEDALGVVP